MGYGESAEDLLMKARCRLLVNQPFYGAMAALIDWKQSDQCPTLGVRMLNGGRVECQWNPAFVEAIGAVPPMMAVIQHEIEHIVRMHIVRHGARDHRLSNAASDMCCNGSEGHPNIPGLPMIPIFDKDGKRMLDDDGKPMEAPPYWYPENEKDLQQGEAYEGVYEWLDKKQDKIFVECPAGCGSCESDLHSNPDKKPKKGQKVIQGTSIDDHEMWDKSEISEDEARQIVKDMVDQAVKKAGSAPGHLTEAIKELQDPKVNWKYLLKQFCGRALGGKRRTFARRNRRIDMFGMAGKSNHATVPLLIGVDVSSSVSSNIALLEQFFSEVESMSHQFKITLVLWDAKVQAVSRYHRGDWKRIPALGGCGTNVVYFFEYLKENRLLHNVVICLTDGEVSSWPQPVDTPVLWCIAGDAVPPWGQTLKLEI